MSKRVPTLRAIVKSATKRTPWHLGNEVLYDLCRKHPLHSDAEVVVTIVLLIGSAHAAVIERRKAAQIETGLIDTLQPGAAPRNDRLLSKNKTTASLSSRDAVGRAPRTP